jgi:MYXO-CTERM domain-containing protein
MRPRLAVAVAAALCVPAAAVPPVALAHQGNPNMESVVRRLTPHPHGITLLVLNRDDRFQLTNRSATTVTVQGYDGEPYARLTPDGTVSVNHNSPAYYLNTDRYGAVTVPKTATPKATPDWHVLDRTGVFEWHDHRMHYMSRGVPPVVKDKSVKTKVFDYRIPIRIGARQGAILGTLWWVPTAGGGAPTGAIIAFAVLAVGGLAAVVVVRRRRRREAATVPAGEAW